jgi:hypothetical protein
MNDTDRWVKGYRCMHILKDEISNLAKRSLCGVYVYHASVFTLESFGTPHPDLCKTCFKLAKTKREAERIAYGSLDSCSCDDSYSSCSSPNCHGRQG